MGPDQPGLAQVGVHQDRLLEARVGQARVPQDDPFDVRVAEVGRGEVEAEVFSVPAAALEDGQGGLDVDADVRRGGAGAQRGATAHEGGQDLQDRLVVTDGVARELLERVDPAEADVRLLAGELVDRAGEALVPVRAGSGRRCGRYRRLRPRPARRRAA